MGLFGGLFGGSPTLNTGSTQPYTSALNSIANNFGSQGKAAQDQYGQFNTNDTNALNALSSYYTTNPATQQYNAEQTANASEAARVGAERAKAGLSMDLANRGIDPNSSAGVGGLTAIANQQASTNANIQAQQAQENERQHAQNLADNANLWNGAASTAFGRTNTLQNQQAGLEQQGFSNADQLAMQQYQQKLQQQQAEEGLASGLFNTAANIFAPGSGAIPAPRAATSAFQTPAPAPTVSSVANGDPWSAYMKQYGIV